MARIPRNPVGAALAREEHIDEIADKLEASLNGASADIAASALARVLNRLSRRSGNAERTVSNDDDAPRGLTGKLLQTLAAKPREPIESLAKSLYGATDRKAQGKVRSLLASLNNSGRVRNVAKGEWEVK